MTNNTYYNVVKEKRPDLFRECVQRATAIANNYYNAHYCPSQIKDELALSAAIEANMMELVYKALSVP